MKENKTLNPLNNSRRIESEAEQFRLLMGSVSDYSIFLTDPAGCVVTWNVGAERILGWAESEIIGRDCRIIFTPEDRAAGDDEREMGTAAAQGRAEDERWHLRKDGSRFFASGTMTALRDEATGELLGFCKILRDLTERKRWEDEMQTALDRHTRVAEMIQHSFLMVPPPDAFPGLAIKPLYESASDDSLIGGDFFDVFAVAENRIALVVGDATGHGIEAATFTAEAKFALRAFLREVPSPADAVRRLNLFLAGKERLAPRHMGDSYIALSLCVVDTQAQELICTWAGIEPPFVIRSGTGEAVELMECSGALLGADVRSEYCEQRVTLSAGDVLAMSTDGLTEARRRNGVTRRTEFFGLDGLIRVVREEILRHPNSLGDAGLAVARQARDFAGGSISDDVCLILARCTG